MNGQWWVDPKQLDEFQQRAIALPFDENHLITGPPGSGKTNLLVLRATNLIRSGAPNILMLVFNRTLEEFIANCPTPYSVPREKLSTILGWEMRLINELGSTPITTGEFKAMRLANSQLLKELVADQKLHNLYNVILLDEAQDCLVEEVELFLRLARNVFVAGDDRQRIYDNASPIPMLQQKCSANHLPHHYRNGEKICALADAIGSNWDDYVPLSGSSQYNESVLPSEVLVTPCNDIAKQAEMIVSKVRLEIKAYPNEMIGVMCPRRKELHSVHEAFKGLDIEQSIVFQSAEQGYLPFTEATRVCLCTLHSAKGLEFRAAHVAGVEFVRNFGERQRRLTYTAVTRAKTILNLYHTGDLPPYLESAVAAVTPTPDPPTLNDLFKTK